MKQITLDVPDDFMGLLVCVAYAVPTTAVVPDDRRVVEVHASLRPLCDTDSIPTDLLDAGRSAIVQACLNSMEKGSAVRGKTVNKG